MKDINLKSVFKMFGIIIATDVVFSIVYFVMIYLSICTNYVIVNILTLILSFAIVVFYCKIGKGLENTTAKSSFVLFILLTIVGLILLLINNRLESVISDTTILSITPLYSFTNISYEVFSIDKLLFSNLLFTTPEKAMVTKVVMMIVENAIRCLLFAKCSKRQSGF